jgi:hypothetical protein
MPFADAADRRISRYLATRFDVVGEQQRPAPGTSAGERSLGAGVSATNHDHIEAFMKDHESIGFSIVTSKIGTRAHVRHSTRRPRAGKAAGWMIRSADGQAGSLDVSRGTTAGVRGIHCGLREFHPYANVRPSVLRPFRQA